MRRETCWRCHGRGFIEYIGDDLRRKRQKAGLSLREVARRIKLTPAYISDVELNRRGATERIMRFYKRVAEKGN